MGGISLNDETGEWVCPLCYSIVKQESGEDDDLFDDDEDEEEAFDNDEVFVAEGDKLIQQTSEEKALITRRATVENIVFKLAGIDNKLASYMDRNIFYIVDQVRFRELSGDPAFSGKVLLPKILAVALHESKIPLSDRNIRAIGGNPTIVRQILRSLTTSVEKVDSEINKKMLYVGKSVGLSEAVIEIMIEQYAIAGQPPNRVGDEYTRAAAWIYLKSKQSKLKGITKSKLKSVPGVKKNALDRAVESYKLFLENGNKPVEGVDTTDD